MVLKIHSGGLKEFKFTAMAIYDVEALRWQSSVRKTFTTLTSQQSAEEKMSKVRVGDGRNSLHGGIRRQIPEGSLL